MTAAIAVPGLCAVALPAIAGGRRHHLDPTQAHENHVHIEINKAAAHKKISFWRSPLA
jgi:hypothetical protein